MTRNKLTDVNTNPKRERGLVNDLLRREKWAEARAVLEREKERDPTSHWIMTQLGVTFYEEKRYEEALPCLRASLEIKPDCPLTLWNVAGTLDALGKHADAVSVYSWLLQANLSSEDDPCWESTSWTESLKADCVYRIGVCFQHLGKTQKAEDCFRQYVNLLSLGALGLYSMDDVRRQLQRLHGSSKANGTAGEFRKAVNAALQISGIEPKRGRRRAPPPIDFRQFAAK